jgi:hypothetical protein
MVPIFKDHLLYRGTRKQKNYADSCGSGSTTLVTWCNLSSVADPGCLSRIRLFSIPNPKYEFFHPGSASKNVFQPKMVSKL